MNRVFGAQAVERRVRNTVRVGVVADDVGVVWAKVGEVIVYKGRHGYPSAIGLGAAHRVVPSCIEVPTWR